ncbi:translation initiation factor Sui1 [Variovorax paradoxus]|uniref:translation initiation factor Sui1 n=1 Tax=Variovorax paradoxus TaxID=34073 RepID=UPI00277F8D63|nr:translation initiation factor Sui1 [Variovorax paradoxus]MDQ0588766.1 translation initiation factor 1 [Variovorax paradoxus]
MATMKSSQASALVYSTEAGGRMCPDCGAPMAQCRCKQTSARIPATDGIVRVSHETEGRKGKGVTVVKGLPLDAAALAALGKQLKTACGSGGTVKDGLIEIQGDHRELVVAALSKQGHTVKRAGG